MSASDATCDLATAVALIPDGATVALGGFSLNRNSTAVACELVRQGRQDLTITQTIAGYETDLLVGAGCVSELVFSGGSLDRLGRLPSVGRAIESGSIRSVSYSGMSLVSRYLAGALGVPFIPTTSLVGSDVLRDLLRDTDEVQAISCPFTDEDVVAVRALQPDFSVISVQRSDARGNFVIDGAHWDNIEMVAASESAIVVANELVTTAALRSTPSHVVAAPHTVAVIPVRWPSFPTAMYGVHDYHEEHLRQYLDRAGSASGLATYLDEFVWSSQDHEAFIDAVLDGASPLLFADSPPRGA